ncbi:hypothetical protein LK540_16735 [Massilia sp. IC2-278]|uniref:hypothetical protein n=1 Tax=Massilia sp. IC2-278 TaxID=2887200 RepID=UPI001E628497|nr:hypothetical protein [Massilia sp. IC2-278]MCC2962077.1 hypothetical protein [Massilia sp. IC2-278]
MKKAWLPALRKAVTCATCIFALVSTGVHAVEKPQSIVVTTTQQGLHQWKDRQGTLIWIAGTEADTVVYRRSFTFYFKSKTSPELVHVPIIEGPVDFTITWHSASRGETTNADAVVAIKNEIIRRIIVTREKSGKTLKTVNYVLVHDDPEYPDGPNTIFKKVSSGSLATKVGQEISDELLKQLAARY